MGLLDNIEEIKNARPTKPKPRAPEKPLQPRPRPGEQPNKRTARFTAAKARQILERVALGETLKEIADDAQFPKLLTMYAWLRDPDNKIDKSPFSVLYQRACEDRALTWADEAATAFRDVEINGDRADMARLKLAGDHARMLVGLVKEQRMARKELKLTNVGKDAPTVIIETFAEGAAELHEQDSIQRGARPLPTKTPD